MNAAERNRLADRLEMTSDVLATQVAGALRRPVTAAELLAGRPAPCLSLAPAVALLVEVDAELAAEPDAVFVRDNLTTAPLSELADKLRTTLKAAAPFVIKQEDAPA
jgi:hypothetical protein